jgi:hypothetical protein
LGLKEEVHSVAFAGKKDRRFVAAAEFSNQTFLKRLSLILIWKDIALKV